MALFLALGGALIAGFLVFALCGSLIYWYETLNSPEERIPSPRPAPAACLRQYGVGLYGYFLCAGLFFFGPFLRRRVGRRRVTRGAPKNQPEGPASGPAEGMDAYPVVCIHGLNNNAAVWLRLARRMDKAGYAVSTYTYCSLFVPLERIVAGLDAHIAEVEAAFPGRRPLLVCHSLGGLLARHWLGLAGNRDRVAGLLTLGTPHGGSKLAVLAPGALAKNLVPGSAFLAALSDQSRTSPLPFPCVSLVSPTDEAVLPAANLLPPDGWRMRVTEPVGHFGMLFRPSVCRMALEELKSMRGHQ